MAYLPKLYIKIAPTMKVIPRTIIDNPLRINFQITLFYGQVTNATPVTDILLQNGTIICFGTPKKKTF